MKQTPARDQSDRNMDFNGMGNGQERSVTAYRGNQYSGVQDVNKEINKGRGPTIGNASSAPLAVGPSVTRDPHKLTIATAEGQSGRSRDYPKNVDAINYGSQQRGAGGTEVRRPKNIDMINPEKNPFNPTGRIHGDQRSAKRPVDPDTINYGPKKQYP